MTISLASEAKKTVAPMKSAGLAALPMGILDVCFWLDCSSPSMGAVSGDQKTQGAIQFTRILFSAHSKAICFLRQ